jgi:hypothetical protein
MELWWPIVNSGVKVVASAAINLPLHLEVQINGDKPLKLTIKTPESEKRIFSVHTRPVTFVRHWPRQARAYVDPQEKTIHHEQQTRVSASKRPMAANLVWNSSTTANGTASRLHR